jgi:hypothetical protein
MRNKIGLHPACKKYLVFFFSMSFLFGAIEQVSGAGRAPEFVATRIHQFATPVYGLAWGDFDPLHDGKEIACLQSNGAVTQISFNPLGWDVALRHVGLMNISWMGERPTIGIGDVDPGHTGNEIIIEGHSTHHSTLIIMVFYDQIVGWIYEVVYDSGSLMGGGWGARVGDFDPRRPGDEILLIYESVMDSSSGILFSKNGGFWQKEIIYDGQVGMDSAAGEFDPNHVGPEIVLVDEMGGAYEIFAPEDGNTGTWPRRTIWGDFENAGWVTKIADVDPCSLGNEIVYGTRYNNRITMSRHNGTELNELEVLFTGNATAYPPTMWDIAVGDVLPDNNGLEIVGVDETGSVYLVWRDKDTWQGRVIWQDTSGALYAVVCGDFLLNRRGDEILVAGESGTVTMLTLSFADSLSGDGIVNFKDFAKLSNYWQQTEPCADADIGPWPIGDGVVNMLDLAVLADSWLQTAYWVE